MKKIQLLLIMIATFPLSVRLTSAEKPQYGGTLKMCHMSADLNPILWDNAGWVWKHAQDTGLYLEHLFMGDLQKGPRGTNEFSFQTTAGFRPM